MEREWKKILICSILLCIIFSFALYVRVVRPYENTVFPEENSFKFAADDSIYHMRFVELTIRYFPSRMFFDPYTEFPRGTFIHFGPIFSQTIAFFSFLAGFGMPDKQTIHTVGALFPAVIGALTIFSVYSIGKEVFDRRCGILAAAILAALPGQFLSRSILGFMDHHSAETFFMTTTVALYIIAIKKCKGIRFGDFLERRWKVVRKPVIYSVMAGISYGMYSLVWVGAPLLLFTLFIFAFFQYTWDHLKGRSTEYLGISGTIAFFTSSLMILPYVIDPTARVIWDGLMRASVAACFLFFGLSVISFFMKEKNVPAVFFPFVLLVLGAVGIATVPLVKGFVAQAVWLFTPPTGGGVTVAERSPLRWDMIGPYFGDIWTGLIGPFSFFFWSIPIIVIYRLIYKDLFKKEEWNPGISLVLIWGMCMMFATFSQNRFAYYFVVNIAINGSYFIVQMLDWVGGRSLYEPRISTYWELRKFLSEKGSSLLLFSFLVVAFFFASINTNLPRTLDQSVGGPAGGDYMQWYYSLSWMRQNTPDPADGKILNYTKFYTRPEDRFFPYPKKGNGTTWYDYERAYGVMSWWDYGHMITFYGHRIPNANPFQAGIGILACPERDPETCEKDENINKSLVPGAAPFLVEKDEEKANKILDVLGTRYVISDWPQATGKFYAVATWAHGGNMGYVDQHYYTTIRTREGGYQRVWSHNFFLTMEARLHFFDGSETDLQGLHIPALKHYRLIYESPAYGGELLGKRIPFIVIYEYLKGAKIRGKTQPNQLVTLSLPLLTNQGRSFTYNQSTYSDSQGNYELVAPYSNEEPKPDWPEQGKTIFAVRAVGPYKITSGNITKEVELLEDEVLYGKVKYLDL